MAAGNILWTTLKVSSLFERRSAQMLKDQELNIKDVARSPQEDTTFYIVSHVHCITGLYCLGQKSNTSV